MKTYTVGFGFAFACWNRGGDRLIGTYHKMDRSVCGSCLKLFRSWQS